MRADSFARAGVQRHAHGEASARDVAVDGVADLRFEHFHLARQIHGDFGLLAVHRAEFDGDFEAVLRAFAAPVTRHGFHSAQYANGR